MPEITQAQLDILNRNNGLMQKLIADGELGVAAKRKLKALDPTLVFPDVDALDAVQPQIQKERDEMRAALEAIKAEREAEKAERENAKLESSFRTKLGEAQAKYKLSNDATDGLLKFMTEKQVADPMIAAAAYLETLPKPPPVVKPSPYLPQGIDLFGANGRSEDQSMKDLHADPVGWMDREIATIMAENEAA